MKNVWKGALTTALLLGASSSPAFACHPESYTGSVCFTAATYCPRGFAPLTGATLDIQSNAALYSLVGTRYGGNGVTNFMLPDLRGRTTVGEGAAPGLTPRYLGEKFGFDQQYLDVTQLPQHIHTLSDIIVKNPSHTSSIPASSAPGDSPTSGIVYPAESMMGDSNFTSSQPDGSMEIQVEVPYSTSYLSNLDGTVARTDVTGNNQPVPMHQPSLVLTACIALEGLYPPRP